MFADLKQHYEARKDRRIAATLDADRARNFAAQTGDLRLDYAKTQIDDTARDMLIGLLDQTGVADKREAMFTGQPINDTEGRAVLHTALRNLDGGAVMVDGQDVMPDVLATLDRMSDFANAVRDGIYKGQGGAITDVVNIGIGGSDLGPKMGTLALAP
ncbi:MAG: glucose-6-phosphate isomerase, partial [Alphaproteobacteria bacterium]|nr:glucose-6-phosphate isomerase [Alphaproteobacteria bacterium]